MRAAEYSVAEMRDLLKQMSAMYDLVRVVDPRECRVLGFGADGELNVQEHCFGVWESGHRCTNCSSADACRTKCNREKKEYFNEHLFSIQSNPVVLRLKDGTTYDAVVELISVSADPAKAAADSANDRGAENDEGKAASFFSRHDSLTRVLNADTFYEDARELLSRNPESPWTIISGDIMGFRMINDLFGIEKGNEVLVKTADMLGSIAGAADGICGRLGSNEFALLLPADSFSEDRLQKIADELVAEESGGVYTLRIHFGVYEAKDASEPVYVMYNRANAALRSIGSDARVSVAYYNDEMLSKDIADHRVISRFSSMLGDGLYGIYLQPLTDGDGVPFGAEALARSFSTDGSIIPPCDFIPVLEEAGLIHELDAYVWELAVRQLSLWKGTDMDGLTISVNISARDFYSMDVFETITGLTEKYGIENSRLRLEVTETALAREPKKVNSILAGFREAGFTVEIDDFGKGYSSLSMLKDTNADVLKIDMGFLQESENNIRSRKILRSIINMADSLGMEVITEGVETEKQLGDLLDMGCRRFQGFYFSRPVPVEEFEKRYQGKPAEL